MTIDSALNIGLPLTPLADDPRLVGELQIVYNALHILQQALNDVGIPYGGTSTVNGVMVPRLAAFTVATLPSAPIIGMLCCVTDALAPVALAVVAGGGARRVPVFYDGAVWIVV